MKLLIQRVDEASVTVENKIIGAIPAGILAFVGIQDDDSLEDIEYLTKKLVNLRIFDDDAGIMNRSLVDTNGELLIVSQFTLQASTKNGNRPSYIKAAKGPIAQPLFDIFCQRASMKLNKPVQTGQFGADMKIKLINNGPVTIWMDSKLK